MTQNRQPSVLIVEDDVDLRRTVSESLEAAGFAAAQSPDAMDAIERLKAFAYDAIVIDLHLPSRPNGTLVFETLFSPRPRNELGFRESGSPGGSFPAYRERLG